jgi:hypothetical protein
MSCHTEHVMIKIHTSGLQDRKGHYSVGKYGWEIDIFVLNMIYKTRQKGCFLQDITLVDMAAFMQEKSIPNQQN